MKITNMQKSTKGGKLKAFFAVEWPDKMIIRDCKLFENDKGELFAKMPDRQYEKDGVKKWTSIVQILDQAILDKITALARQAYNGDTPRREENPF